MACSSAGAPTRLASRPGPAGPVVLRCLMFRPLTLPRFSIPAANWCPPSRLAGSFCAPPPRLLSQLNVYSYVRSSCCVPFSAVEISPAIAASLIEAVRGLPGVDVLVAPYEADAQVSGGARRIESTYLNLDALTRRLQLCQTCPPTGKLLLTRCGEGEGGEAWSPALFFKYPLFPPPPSPPPLQMAFLAHNGHVDAVVTEDSDLFAHACPVLLYKVRRAGGGAYFGGRPFLWALLRARLYKVRSGVACLLACPPRRVGVCTHMHPLEWLACAPPYGQCGALHRATFLLAISSIVHACPRAAYMHAAHAHNWTDGAVHRA